MVVLAPRTIATAEWSYAICMQKIKYKFMLYADDLVLIPEPKELLLEKVRNWKKGMEKKGMRVNAGKTSHVV